MAGDKDKKDKNRARLAERRRVTMPETKSEGKEKARSSLVRSVQKQRNEQAARVKAAPKTANVDSSAAPAVVCGKNSAASTVAMKP